MHLLRSLFTNLHEVREKNSNPSHRNLAGKRSQGQVCRKLTVEKFRKKVLEFCKSKKQKSYGEQKHGLGQRTNDNIENETIQNKKKRSSIPRSK